MVELNQFLLMRGLHRSFKHLFLAVAYILFVLAVGTVGYTHFENLQPLDALYFSVVTLSTIGYGDISPQTYAGKVFTIFFIPLGVSAFMYTFGAVSMAIFEGEIMEVLKLEQNKQDISKLMGHTILCGYGEVGEYVAKNTGKTIVAVENNEERYKKALKDGYYAILGDSTNSDVLKEAGAENASSIVIALAEDPKTVFTILTVKDLNPTIKVYARANRRGVSNKIRTAGADYVVCLPEIGGKELINAIEHM